ncbi:MAG: hypothetical protein ACE5OP_04510 [Candidatus Glassbacteria bacterium]
MKTYLGPILAIILFTAPLLSVVDTQLPILEGRFGIWQLGEDDNAEDVRDCGISYVVKQYRWEQIEPEQDLFRFKPLDDWYDDMLEPYDLSGVLIIRTGQSWATDNSYDSTLGKPLHEFASAPPLDYGDYYDYIYNVVYHLKDKIDIFIIENEPVTRVAWYGTPEEYILLTSVAYQAAKDANPSCMVIANKLPAMGFGYLIARDLFEQGAFSEAMNFWNGYYSRRDERFQVSRMSELVNWLNSDFGLWVANFVDVIMTSEQAENLDAIGFNYYLHYDYIEQVVGWIRSKMEENGFYRPLLDLEHGVKDERSVVSDSTASEELVKGYVIVQSLGIRYISWYPFTLDSTSHNFEYLKPMHDYSTDDFFPCYYAMNTIADHFDYYHFFHGKDESFYSRYSFENLRTGLVDLDIIWSDSLDTTVTLPFPKTFNCAIVTDHLGSAVDSLYNLNETLEIQVGAAPKFIQYKRVTIPPHHDPDSF